MRRIRGEEIATSKKVLAREKKKILGHPALLEWEPLVNLVEASVCGLVFVVRLHQICWAFNGSFASSSLL